MASGMDRKKCTLRSPLAAGLRDYRSDPIAFQAGDSLWWDSAQSGDPVVFDAGGLRFTADRLQFLQSIEDSIDSSTALIPKF